MGKTAAGTAKETRRAERAEVLFIMYYEMGPERSLEALRNTCAKLGLKLHLNTYKGYSADFNWQRKVLERSVAERAEREKDTLGQVDKMNQEHINVHRGLMGIAVAGINYYQTQLEQKRTAGLPASLKLSVEDIVRLVRQAQVGERLARGQATSRAEVVVEVISTFVQEFALIFKAVNDIADPAEREREYIRQFDERLRETYTAVITGPAVKKLESGW